MLWQEILVDQPLTSEAIIMALSELFKVSIAAIAVIEDLATLAKDEDLEIICEKLKG